MKKLFLKNTSKLEDGSMNFSIYEEDSSDLHSSPECIHYNLNTKTFLPLSFNYISGLIENYDLSKNESINILEYLYLERDREDDLDILSMEHNEDRLFDNSFTLGEDLDRKIVVKDSLNFDIREDLGVFEKEIGKNHSKYLGKNIKFLISKIKIIDEYYFNVVDLSKGEIIFKERLHKRPYSNDSFVEIIDGKESSVYLEREDQTVYIASLFSFDISLRKFTHSIELFKRESLNNGGDVTIEKINVSDSKKVYFSDYRFSTYGNSFGEMLFINMENMKRMDIGSIIKEKLGITELKGSAKFSENYFSFYSNKDDDYRILFDLDELKVINYGKIEDKDFIKFKKEGGIFGKSENLMKERYIYFLKNKNIIVVKFYDVEDILFSNQRKVIELNINEDILKKIINQREKQLKNVESERTKDRIEKEIDVLNGVLISGDILLKELDYFIHLDNGFSVRIFKDSINVIFNLDGKGKEDIELDCYFDFDGNFLKASYL